MLGEEKKSDDQDATGVWAIGDPVHQSYDKELVGRQAYEIFFGYLGK